MERRVVYDSDAVQPGQCPTCGKRLDRCTCGAARSSRVVSKSSSLPRDGVVRLLRESKGRGGKGVTLISGVPGSPAALQALASDLKRFCATGGTLRGDIIEIQGDQRLRLKPELERRGYQVKIAGA